MVHKQPAGSQSQSVAYVRGGGGESKEFALRKHLIQIDCHKKQKQDDYQIDLQKLRG